MTLHIFSASPSASGLLEDCCTTLRDGDVLLLLGEGVHAASPDSAAARRLAALSDGVSLRALAEDCVERGINDLMPRCSTADDAEFVKLACAHARSVSWF